MKKSELQKPIKTVLNKYGFERVKGNDYSIISKDGKTKLVLRIPDGKKGFILGAQFSDLGVFDGAFSHSSVKQYDFAYELSFAAVKDYPEEEIIASTEKVCAEYTPYIDYGSGEIKKRINEWTFGDLDDNCRDAILRYFGSSGIDPYSEEYLADTVERLGDGGRILLTEEEYYAHKDFYDKYEAHGAKITLDEKQKSVAIDFSGNRKWYQK